MSFACIPEGREMVFSSHNSESIMKMKQCILGCMTVAVVLGCSVASVKADDIYQPPWQRGSANTTFESWNFGTAANPSGPDMSFNPYGTPAATISGGTWSQFYDNHFGVWTLGSGGSIDFFIPNTPVEPTRNKVVWTQLTWQPDNNGLPVVTVAGVVSQLVLSAPVGIGGWVQSVYETTLPFNPAAEDVVISGALPGTTLDVGQVVIDTICIPEPSSLALLGMGAVSLLLYASRKRRLAA